MLFRVALSLLLLMLCVQAEAEDRFDALRAAYVYYLTKFVEWPNSPQDLTICVRTDSDALAQQFESLSQKPYHTGHLLVRQLEQGQALTGCHILYLDEPESVPVDMYEQTAVLVVSSTPSERNAVYFLVQDNKLRFVIRRAQGEAQGLKFSAKLLDLAVKVY